ncbi:hypothetical protein AKJ52_02210 [candidate division MSBL1 archaeon SCGC-AAA382C18]|uniref:Ribose-phosphate pyrophosphokinase n=1 Tax=candidate division MSBL1 archaeon SCGC-AAA382C18 TaxID=1698281 RepID=A0A133VJ58_9EURY|nr:hypothetical protein AKJ52_02210 [candidate division MSBL1 archaeon SCGC-AAA382C18]
MIVGGSASENLAEKISERMDCDLSIPEFEKFPDGEVYVRLTDDVEGEDVVVVQSTCYPPNQNYMELFLLLDVARDSGAEQVSAVVPYFGYGRQDKRFESGEAVSLETVANLIECSGADEVYMMDIHPQPIERSPEVFDIPAHNLTAADILAEYIDQNYSLSNPVVFGPDSGAEEWAKRAGEAIGADWDYMTKKRLGPEEVEITPREINVEERDVIIVDDIISTGGTMREAIDILKSHGSNDVFIACTHPVLVDDALDKLRDTGVKDIVATDTIEGEVSKVSIASVVSEALSQ